MLALYLCMCGCREEKCVSLVPMCGWVSGGTREPRTYVWVGVGRRYMYVLVSYLRAGGCREEKCVSLARTYVRVGV